jgi:MFS family permease
MPPDEQLPGAPAAPSPSAPAPFERVENARSPLLPIFLIVLVDILGLTIMIPLLPFYTERFGASPFTVGLLVATYAGCQLVSGPMLGALSDRIGKRRPLLLVSQLGTFVGLLILADARSLVWLFVGRIIDGLTAGNLSLAQAYISDVTEPKNRARAFGLIGVAFGIGFLIGPAISGVLVRFGYAVPILLAAGLSFGSVCCTFFLLPKGTSVRRDDGAGPGPGGQRLGVLEWSRYADFFRRVELGALLLQFFAFALYFATFVSGFSLFSERRFTLHGHPFGTREVGYVFAYVGFLGIILQGGLIGRLVKRFGERALVVAGFLSSAVGYFALGFTYSIPILLVTATVSSFGSGVLRPCLTSLITQRVSRTEQGVILGLNQSLMSVAQIVGPLVAGTLIDRGQLVAWTSVVGGLCAIGLALAFSTRRSPIAPAEQPT